ncbi:glycosyltransferase family 2 protein [Thioclava sp.]|uniref:glycosyltransferase family 2 protein n=1 Tax=Thioclava sp. TaxID=1933450 RepID=UPI003242466F
MAHDFDISVIIPCYNTENYIEDCIRSALNQERIRVQVILVDDCSTDATLAKAQAFLPHHPHLQIIQNSENQGQARSRNSGLNVAQGRYVALLDSDDYYIDSSVLAHWVEEADRRNADLCVAQSDSLIEKSGKILPRNRVPLLSQEVGTAASCPQLVNVRQCWQILYRRDFLDQENIRFSTVLRQREDRLFFLEALLRAKSIAVLDLVAIMHREHPASTMKKKNYDQLSFFTTHMTLLAQVFARARADRVSSDDFERANAGAYWNQTFFYWAELLRQKPSAGLAPEGTEADSPVSQGYLTALHDLTRHAGPLFRDRYLSVQGEKETAQQEGIYDIARICLELGRRDLMQRLLAGQRLHYLTVYELAEQSQFSWAEEAATHYLRFNRNAEFADMPVSADPWKTLAGIKRLVVHVGQPKTGSSAVQHFLEDSRLALSKNGVLYPLAGCGRDRGIRRDRSPGHALLFSKAAAGDDRLLVNLATEIENQLAPVHTVVLSAENVLSAMFLGETSTFFDIDPLGCLLKRIGAQNVEIVGIFRDQSPWLQSYYRELVANPFNGYVQTPPSFLKRMASSGLLEYDRLKAHMASLPYVGSTHFADYDEIKSEGVDQWFFRLLGLEHSIRTWEKGTQINVSLTDAQALKILFTKSLELSRQRRGELYLEIRNNVALKNSNFKFFDQDTSGMWQGKDDHASSKEIDKAWFKWVSAQDGFPAIASLIDFDLLQESAAGVAAKSRTVKKVVAGVAAKPRDTKKGAVRVAAQSKNIKNTQKPKIIKAVKVERRQQKTWRKLASKLLPQGIKTALKRVI